MKLDVYRSCSRREKRQVLEAFWHRDAEASSRIHQAAGQYGPYAVISLVAVALELLVVVLVSIDRATAIAALAIFFEVLDLVSLWWALVRLRSFKGDAAAAP